MSARWSIPLDPNTPVVEASRPFIPPSMLEPDDPAGDAVRRLMDAAHVFVTYASVTDSNPTLRAEANVWLERYRALVRSEGGEARP